MSFVSFLDMGWPEDARDMITVSVADVQAWRDAMVDQGKAPKTINRRISSVSSFYKYTQAAAAALRLPISIPNSIGATWP
jgi:site-specific recombinase XerD